jgi:hypothetical protein
MFFLAHNAYYYSTIPMMAIFIISSKQKLSEPKGHDGEWASPPQCGDEQGERQRLTAGRARISGGGSSALLVHG